MATHKVELEPIRTPNFILKANRSYIKGDEQSIAVGELSADTLSELCDEFRAGLFAKAGKKDPRTERANSSSTIERLERLRTEDVAVITPLGGGGTKKYVPLTNVTEAIHDIIQSMKEVKGAT